MIRAAVLLGAFILLLVLLALARRVRSRGLRIGGLITVGVMFALFWAEVLASTVLMNGPLSPLRVSEVVPCAWQFVSAGEGRLEKVGVPRNLLAMDGRRPGHFPDLFRIMFVGDSFTAGQGVHTGEEFAALVAEALRPRVSPRKLQLIKHAKPGMGFATEYILFQDYSANYAPDVVIWVFVLNDLPQSFHTAAPGLDDYIVDRTMLGFEPSWSRAWDFVRLSLRRHRAGRRMVQAYRDTFDPAKNSEQLNIFESRLTELSRSVRSRGARFVFVIFPLLVDLQAYPFQDAHKTVAGIAQAAGAETLDLLPFFARFHERKLWAAPDDHHPNLLGHRIAAEAIADHLLKGELPSAGARSCRETPGVEIAQVTGMLEDGRREEAHCLLRDLACRQPDSPQVALAMAQFHLAAAKGVDDRQRYSYAYWTLVVVHALHARLLAAELPRREQEELESKIKETLEALASAVGVGG